MSCNRILKAITNQMPPKCFNCCAWEVNEHVGEKGYCWLMHKKTMHNEKPDLCPLVKEESVTIISRTKLYDSSFVFCTDNKRNTTRG